MTKKTGKNQPVGKARPKKLPWTSRRESAPGVVMRTPRMNRKKGKG